MSILVVGSIALDTITTRHGVHRDVPGGSALYFSAAASLFTDVRVVGAIGSDFPNEPLEVMREKGIDTDGIVRSGGESFRWWGEYSPDFTFRTTHETLLGPYEAFKPVLPRHYTDSEVVFLANLGPDVQMEVLRQVDSPRLTALDTMELWINETRSQLLEAISMVDILIVTDEELLHLSGEANLLAGSRWAKSHGIRTVVVKRGEYGAMLVGEEVYVLPGFPLEGVRDPTGAGDSFAGGFLGYVAANLDARSAATDRTALLYASAMGSFAVGEVGPGSVADRTREEVDRRARELKSVTESGADLG